MKWVSERDGASTLSPMESAINNARAKALAPVVGRLLDDLATLVIADIKALPDSFRQSPDDMGLDSVWEEFKYQVQREESITFEAFEFEIRLLCARRVDALEFSTRFLLWCWSDGIVEWDEDQPPPLDEIPRYATDEVYRRVCEFADDEELKSDPDAPSSSVDDDEEE